MQQQTLPHDSIEPNSYNPNVMTERVYEAEMESILLYGFIDPLTVRTKGAQVLIIDGEHRWKAFEQLRSLWLNGELCPMIEHDGHWVSAKVTKSDERKDCHPSLLPLFEANTLPVTNLGEMPDADAKKLTIILNETRGRANTVDLAALLAEIGVEMGGEDLGRGLPYNPAELGDLLKLVEYDWNATANTPAQDGTGEGDNSDTESLQTFTVTMAQSNYALYLQATERVKERLAQDDIALASDEPLFHAQVIALLADQFLLCA